MDGIEKTELKMVEETEDWKLIHTGIQRAYIWRFPNSREVNCQALKIEKSHQFYTRKEKWIPTSLNIRNTQQRANENGVA